MLHRLSREGFSSRPLGNQRLNLRALQAVEHERVMWERGGQGGLNSGREGQHVQHGYGGRLLDHSPSTSSVVGSAQSGLPLHQHRLPLGLRLHPRQQCVERLLFLLLPRCQRQRRTPLLAPLGQEPGQQRYPLG